MSSIQSIIEGSLEKAGYNSLVGLIMLVVAFVPLGTSLLAVCLSQAVLKQQRGIHANKRLDTPLDELQSRLREALLVDRTRGPAAHLRYQLQPFIGVPVPELLQPREPRWNP